MNAPRRTFGPLEKTDVGLLAQHNPLYLENLKKDEKLNQKNWELLCIQKTGKK